MSTNTATALVPVSASTALEPTSLDEAFKLCQRLTQSGLLKGIAKPEAAFAILLTGRELGLTVMQSLRSIYAVDGKPTLSADLMAALVMRSPVCKFFRVVKTTNAIATYETQRDGYPEPTAMSFTIEDAQAAKLTGKQNWQNYPAAMLRARCIAALARAVYPDLLAGIYETDEIDVTPVQPTPLRAVAEPVPQPEDVQDAEVVDPGLDVVGDWRQRFDAAATLAELQTVALGLKNIDDETLKATLRAEYNDSRKRFASKPKAKAEAAPAREVGEEG